MNDHESESENESDEFFSNIVGMDQRILGNMDTFSPSFGKETTVLGNAADIIEGRESENGPAHDSLVTITELWNTYLGDEHPDLSAEQAAVMLGLLKVGRHANGDNDMDDIVDLAGYAELAGRMREFEQDRQGEMCDCCVNDETGTVAKF